MALLIKDSLSRIPNSEFRMVLLSTSASAALSALALLALAGAAHDQRALRCGLLRDIALAHDQDGLAFLHAIGDLGLVAIFQSYLDRARDRFAVWPRDHDLPFPGGRRPDRGFGQQDHVFFF